MTTLRVSVTDLDQYAFWRASETMTTEDLLKSLRYEGPKTDAMLRGIAFHAALENVRAGVDYRILRARQHTFIIDCAIELPPMTPCEMLVTRDYRVGSLVVQARGKLDAIHGIQVRDRKSHEGPFDIDRIERYKDSMQWRLYLDMVNALEFWWDSFTMEPVAPLDPHDGSVYRVLSYGCVNQWRYPGMVDDITSELSEFAEFCREYLPERFVEETAQ